VACFLVSSASAFFLASIEYLYTIQIDWSERANFSGIYRKNRVGDQFRSTASATTLKAYKTGLKPLFLAGATLLFCGAK
jgi:hypothetical protein